MNAKSDDVDAKIDAVEEIYESVDTIDNFLGKSREQGAFSGAVYAIGSSSGILRRGEIGTLSWDGEPVRPDSLWDLASITKPIAMLPVIKLLEQGELYLEDTIEQFLPDYRHTDKADITIRQLLSHSSGIPGQQPLYKTAGTKTELLEAVRKLPLRYAPGTDVEYTSQGYMILGNIIEAVAGQRLDAVLEQAVFAPVGMKETVFNPPERLWERIAATEYCEWRQTMVRGEVHDENAIVLGGIAGHAGLFSTVEDLSLLCRAMLQLGETYEGVRFLQPQTVELMTRNHTPGLKLGRALGWQVRDAQHSPAGDLFSSASFGHTGFTGTSMWMDPQADVFAVLLTNRVHPTRTNASIKRVRSIFHNLAMLFMRDAVNAPEKRPCQGEADADN